MRLTVRVKPIKGEALSSYLLRLAEGNGLEFLKLWNLIKKQNRHFIQMDDLKVLNFAPINAIDIDKLVLVADINEEELLQCTFLYLLSKFNNKDDLERSRFLSGMIRDEFYYCPACIKQKPHYQLIWSINGIYTCVEHNIRLPNHCVHCNQTLMIQDMKSVGICPKCGGKLTDVKIISQVKREDAMQPWLYEFWAVLLSKSSFSISSSELAAKLLFILNNFDLQFDRERVRNIIGNKMKLAVLLQHVRESLSQERVLHISFLIECLYKYNLTIKEFMELKVPVEFVDSVGSAKQKKSYEVSCLAPWCNNYNIKGTLNKTATSYKQRKDKSELFYYLVCPDCGCEYAYNTEGKLIERTNLIRAYEKLIIINDEEISQKELAKMCDLTLDKLKRCLAYFYSRGMFLNYSKFKCEIDKNIIKKVVENIKNNESIKDIQNWEIWQNYQHFLVYRYHNDVIKQLNNMFVPREERVDKLKLRQEIEKELQYMLDNEIEITISSVAIRLSVCPETLRLWGCNEIIAYMKNQQKEKWINERSLYISDKLEALLSEHKQCIIIVPELYKTLGIKRNVLWRKSPELTATIYKRIKEHNAKIREAAKEY